MYALKIYFNLAIFYNFRYPWESSIFARCRFTPQCIQSIEKTENQHGDDQVKEGSVFTDGNKNYMNNVPFYKLPRNIKEYPRKHMFLNRNPRNTQVILKDIKTLLGTPSRKIYPS